MNILVTGGNGFIGRNLIKFLYKNKKFKLSSTIFKNKNNIFRNKKIRYYKVDLKNKKDCLRLTKKIDVVIMCAANSSGAKIMRQNPMEHFNPNIFMNLNMLEASYQNNVKKFIFISSNAIYPVSKNKMKEKDVNNEFFEGYFIAAWMKKISEVACEIYSKKLKKKMKTIIIRPGNLYGPFDKFDKEKSKVIPSLIRKIDESRNALDVWGDGKDLKDFLYIDDFSQAIKKIILQVNDHECFNIASGKSVSINKIIKILLRLYNLKNCKINYQKNMPRMIPVRKINIKKISNKIKWRPKIDLTQGLKKTINYYKNLP